MSHISLTYHIIFGTYKRHCVISQINAKTQLLKFRQRRAGGSRVLLSPSDASAEGGVAVASNKRSPGRGDCVKYCIGEHHTLAPARGSHCVFSFAPPSADASDGDSDTTEPSALSYLNCAVRAVRPIQGHFHPFHSGCELQMCYFFDNMHLGIALKFYNFTP